VPGSITLGQELRFFYARSESDLDTAFGALIQQQANALLVGNDVFFTNRREQIVALAARHAVPTIYAFRQFAESGGLMSYIEPNRPRGSEVDRSGPAPKGYSMVTSLPSM
jgi:hypothetical protein